MNTSFKPLSNKTIVVTGGYGLLGKAFIEDIKNKGGIGISLDISHPTNFELNQIHADVTTENSISKVIKEISQQYGNIDGWVNNAYPRTKDWGTDFLNLTEESLKTNVDLQMNSYILCCKEIIKHMLDNKVKGSIVNIASIYGIVGNDFTIYEGTDMKIPSPYSAIKGGVINFSRFLASRFGADEIRINTVSPGGIFDNQPPSFVKEYERKVPMKRMGNPNDIAPAVSFLLSDQAGYITGQNLAVDGGWTSI